MEEPINCKKMLELIQDLKAIALWGGSDMTKEVRQRFLDEAEKIEQKYNARIVQR